MAPVNTQNTWRNDVSFHRRQNIITVKIFLTAVGHNEKESLGTPEALLQEKEEAAWGRG